MDVKQQITMGMEDLKGLQKGRWTRALRRILRARPGGLDRPRPAPRAEMQQNFVARQQLAQQKSENDMVLEVGPDAAQRRAGAAALRGPRASPPSPAQELSRLSEESNVYKLIGPALVKQDMVEARSNVTKRLDFIKSEVERLEKQMKDIEGKVQAKQQEVGGAAAPAPAYWAADASAARSLRPGAWQPAAACDAAAAAAIAGRQAAAGRAGDGSNGVSSWSTGHGGGGSSSRP
jgi:chaperonin cofactor prefoldin